MMATCCIQPLDMVKVRIQLGMPGSPLSIASHVVKTEGVGALYRGLSAGLLRQATYTTARLGLFEQFMQTLRSQSPNGEVSIQGKAAAGLAAGGLGALVGSPADLSLVRMQADGTLPVEQRRNYKNAGDALLRIMKEEGVGGLFAGAGPTVVRAMSLNMGMLASNEQAKDMLKQAGFQGAPVTFGASAIAGFFASFFSLPFDFVKTQMQKQQPLPDGTLPYKNSVDCAMQTLTKHGPMRFYAGFPTYYVRIAPHAMITLIALDALKEAQKKFGL